MRALTSLVTILALVAPAAAQAERPPQEATPKECPRCGHADGGRRLGERGRERLERRIGAERRLERRLEERLERRSELRERIERRLREQGEERLRARGKGLDGERRAERAERLREELRRRRTPR